jgi:hypothetical protein
VVQMKVEKKGKRNQKGRDMRNESRDSWFEEK